MHLRSLSLAVRGRRTTSPTRRPAASVVMRHPRWLGVGALGHRRWSASTRLRCGRRRRPVRGGQGRGSTSPPRGVREKNVRSTGPLVAGTPGQAAVDESRGEGRAHRVRAELSGRTAIQLGEACPGSDRGCLRPGGKPLPLPGVDHLGASWGHGRAPLPARGIRTETPPAGAATAPLYGRGQDNHTR